MEQTGIIENRDTQPSLTHNHSPSSPKKRQETRGTCDVEEATNTQIDHEGTTLKNSVKSLYLRDVAPRER